MHQELVIDTISGHPIIFYNHRDIHIKTPYLVNI